MKKPIEFLSEAETEYLSALAWYRERSPAAAIKFEAEFNRSIKQIRETPGAGLLICGIADGSYFTSFHRNCLSRHPNSYSCRSRRSWPSETWPLERFGPERRHSMGSSSGEVSELPNVVI